MKDIRAILRTLHLDAQAAIHKRRGDDRGETRCIKLPDTIDGVEFGLAPAKCKTGGLPGIRGIEVAIIFCVIERILRTFRIAGHGMKNDMPRPGFLVNNA